MKTRDTLLLVFSLYLFVGCNEQKVGDPISAESVEICKSKKSDFPTAEARINYCLGLMYPNRSGDFISTVVDSRIKIKFELEGNFYEVFFSTRGKWITSEVKLPPENLPDRIRDALSASDYSNWTVGKIKLFQTVNAIAYEVEVGKRMIGTDRYVLLFNEESEIISVKKK